MYIPGEVIFTCHKLWKVTTGRYFTGDINLSLISDLLPNNYVLNGVGLAIRMNEDDCLNEDCLNPMTSNEFGVVR